LIMGRDVANRRSQACLDMTGKEESVRVKEKGTYEPELSEAGPETPRLMRLSTNLSTGDDDVDWRNNIVKYLMEPGRIKDKKVQRQALKYVMMGDELYRRTTDGLLLKCLGKEQLQIVMGGVHKGLCETHQSAFKMKWTLSRA
jgi:hypothetical protein